MNDQHLRYPIGEVVTKVSYTPQEIQSFIHRIETLPSKVRAVALALEQQNKLSLTYREGGWTALQVIHHIPDSHLNAYMRCKLALTEDTPTIKPYDENAWAQTPDTNLSPTLPLLFLESIHQKFVALLKGISPTDYTRKFYHPGSGKHVAIQELMALYAWHGDHHLAHLNIIANK
jgi:hypothetical protein